MTIPQPRLLSELSDLEKLSLIELSYSRMENYEKCPAKYFYSHVIKEPSTTNAAALLGNVIHSVLELHVGEDDFEINEIIRSYEAIFEEYNSENEMMITEELYDLGRAMLYEFVDRHDGDEFNVIGREEFFEFVLGNAHIRGYIDRIDQIDDTTLHVIDYKSGKWQVSAKDIDTNLQLSIYSVAMMLKYPEVDTVNVELYYLRSGKRLSAVFYRKDLAIVTERIWGLVASILEDKYFHETKTNKYVCNFCEHATSGRCKVGLYNRNNKRK